MKPDKTTLLKNNEHKKLKELRGLVLSSKEFNQDFNNETAKKEWEKEKNIGCHYCIDGDSLTQYIKDDEVCEHTAKGKQTYISSSLYESKPNLYTVGLNICITKGKDYLATEKKAIKFCAEFLLQHKLTTDNLWREFDLNKTASPAQYLDKKRWRNFVKEVKEYMEKSKDKDFNPKTYIIKNCFINDDELRKYIEVNEKNMSVILEKLQPDDRGIGNLASKKGMEMEGEIQTIETSHGNIVTYSITQAAPGAEGTDVSADFGDLQSFAENFDDATKPKTDDKNKSDKKDESDDQKDKDKTQDTKTENDKKDNTTSQDESTTDTTNATDADGNAITDDSVSIDTSFGGDSCVAPIDEAAVKVNPKECKVDPTYPDTIVPPGTSTSVFNSKDDSKKQQIKSSIPSVEEYNKRQQIFDPKKHADAIKESKGKPVNNNDPYPVDEKIKELQEHSPKIKIDETNFKLGSCNHPGCEVASTLINLSAMMNDAMVDQSKRIERRLVLLENTMATVLRYVFRMSSRINVNCTYYGGQDVFGKQRVKIA